MTISVIVQKIKKVSLGFLKLVSPSYKKLTTLEGKLEKLSKENDKLLKTISTKMDQLQESVRSSSTAIEWESSDIRNILLKRNDIQLTPKVSVIVPVYNVESYLHECLRSVVTQTESDIEIIIVDDVSTDNSRNIIREFQIKDDRINFLTHKLNCGVGGARNTGVAAARAEYLMFVDSDDWLEPHAIKTAFDEIVRTGSDFVQFGYRQFRNGNNETRRVKADSAVFYEHDIFNKHRDHIVTHATWNKIYRKSIFTKYGITQPEKAQSQDLAIINYFAVSRKAVLINDILINYRKRDDSEDNTVSEGHITSKRVVFNMIKEFLVLNKLYDKSKPNYHLAYFSTMHYLYSRIKTYPLSNAERRRLVDALLKAILLADQDELISIGYSISIFTKKEKHKFSRMLEELASIKVFLGPKYD